MQSRASRVATPGPVGFASLWPLGSRRLPVYVLGLFVPAVATYPASLQLSTAPWWGEAVRWVNVHFFDTMDAIKTAAAPQRSHSGQTLHAGPALAAASIALLAFAGWRLGGARLATLVAALPLFVALTGHWLNGDGDRLSLRHLGRHRVRSSASRSAFWRGLERARLARSSRRSSTRCRPCRASSTSSPSSCSSALAISPRMIAIVLYALAPAIRYTALGIRDVQPSLIEAGDGHGLHAAGSFLTKSACRLPCRRFLLGINQTYARNLDARHHRACRDARSRPGGLHRLDQGRCRARNRGRARRRDHRHHRRPSDPDRRSAVRHQAGMDACIAGSTRNRRGLAEALPRCRSGAGPSIQGPRAAASPTSQFHGRRRRPPLRRARRPAIIRFMASCDQPSLPQAAPRILPA